MPKPILYDLFWRKLLPAPAAPVGLGGLAVLREPDEVPALILYPALLTPAIHLRAEAGSKADRFEILMAAKHMSPAAFAQEVNRRLQVQLGLDARKRTSYVPLFDDPAGKIEVEKVVADGYGMLKLAGGFRGILHPLVKLPAELDTFYQVRIAASCLERAARREAPADAAVEPPAIAPSQDVQDDLIQKMLLVLNGPELRGANGFGLHAFRVEKGEVHLDQADLARPVRAYHPLFVYPEGGLEHATLGHVSDLHLNARQAVLARSDARVIDAAGRGHGDQGLSPRIGALVNVYASSFSSILSGLEAAGADLLLVGGDLVDHAHNCWPFFEAGAVPAADVAGNPAKIWGLVDLDHGASYRKYYQAYVDMLSFYSIIRDYSETTLKPVYVVSGNHDAYEHAFGISPRVLKAKANEGIPADHNLTMYEAILAFGESFGKIVKKRNNFTPKVFEWFFNVLSPFSDYAVPLPRQRLVALHWGESEKMFDVPFTNHGFGHLPRADQAATEAQLALVRDGLDADRKTVLFSHFTFVSYAERIPSRPFPVAGTTTLKDSGFGEHDMGTFDQRRAELYRIVESARAMQCVFTGHSHRKGLYLVAGHGDTATTVSYPIPMCDEAGGGAGLKVAPGFTPIIVSDCAGPLPRLNLIDEFLDWGSDRPSGTLARISEGGEVKEVLAIGAISQGTKPRLAVALECLQVLQAYLHIQGAVFGAIETSTFDPWSHKAGRISLRFTLGKVFDRVKPLRLDGVGLWCLPTTKPEAWVKLELPVKRVREGDGSGDKVAEAGIPKDQQARNDFLAWLRAPAAGRFMSLTFAVDAGVPADQETWRHLERYDLKSPWNFQVDCTFEGNMNVAKYRVVPRFEAPNFDWRRKLMRYQA